MLIEFRFKNYSSIKFTYVNILLSKYKIFDNLRRSLLEISIIISFIYLIILKNALNVKTVEVIALIYVSFLMPFLFEIINEIIFKKEGEKNKAIEVAKKIFCQEYLELRELFVDLF